VTLQKSVMGLVSAIGAAVFGFFFLLTYHTPSFVERSAADFIEREATKRVHAVVDGMRLLQGDTALARMAASVQEHDQEEIERHREALRQRVHARKAEGRIRTARIGLLEQRSAQLTDLIHSTYARVVTDLKRDIRIFTGANAAMFLMVLGVVLLKPQALRPLLVPGVLLVVATLVCSHSYLFQQDWLLTIIYNDYLGFAYLAYLGLVFGFLCDIVLNGARITSAVVNAISATVGSTAAC
jgi:hypothetical protein